MHWPVHLCRQSCFICANCAANVPSRRLIYGIVFIEGFCSLGAEIIALRRLLPHVGSSIIVTAPTIALFLLALALGYAAGARVASDYLKVVARNFLVAGLLVGIGLSNIAVDGIFAHIQPTLLAYLLVIGGILCPIAWLLGQTVPILSNLTRHERTGEASGSALYWSTLGSFVGSFGLSLLIMQWLGIAAAVSICALGLFLGYAMLVAPLHKKYQLTAVLATFTTLAVNTHTQPLAATAYADYAVESIAREGLIDPRVFRVNQSAASMMDSSEPPHYTRYIEHIRQILRHDLALHNQNILVLGAGGFTLSHRESTNHYTYVDIDPAIRDVAEQHFLREGIRGEFIVDDARRFVRHDTRQFAAIVVDVFSSHTAIPSHLVTQEFWTAVRPRLQDDGTLIVNLILDGQLATPYARNVLATIENVYGRCAVDVLHKAKPLANVVVTCFAGNPPTPAGIYRDETNRADLDRARSR